MPLSTLSLSSAAFCTDEAIWGEARSDFKNLAPESEKIARGSDGIIAAAAPWSLASAAVNFQSQGVTDAHIVKLYAATGGGVTPDPATKSYLGPEGEFAAIDGTPAGTTADLRRPGRPARTGQPYAPPGVTLTTVAFEIYTFAFQIATATSLIRNQLRRVAADVTIATRVEDADLTRLCVLWVLANSYRNRSQALSPQGGGADIYGAKYRDYLAEFQALLTQILGRLGARVAISSGAYATDPLSGGDVLRPGDWRPGLYRGEGRWPW